MAESTTKVYPDTSAAPLQQQQQPYGATYGGAGVVQMQPVVITQMMQPTKVGQKQNERPWSSGICGCFEDCCSLCYAYWCYPCFLCSLANSMDEFCCGPWCFCTGGSGNCGGTLFPNPFLVGMRGRLRGQYGIKGSVCQDAMCIWCCECCATTQMAREIKHWSNQ